MQFEYTIEHRPSRKMCLPDALSRLPLEEDQEEEEDETVLDVNLICESLPVTFKEIVNEAKRDQVYGEWVRAIHMGFPCKVHGDLLILKRAIPLLSLEGGVIFYGHRVVIPRKLQERVLKYCHEGHQGIVIMKKIARKYVYWPNLDKDIESWVATCTSCQSWSTVKKERVTSTWKPCMAPFERVHIDFFQFRGNTALLIVDAFSKLIEVYPMQKTDAKAVTNKLEDFFGLFGFPKMLVSDNGPPFQSFEFKQFCQARGIECIKSPVYHPESNGQAEGAVRIVKNTIKKLCMDKNNRYQFCELIKDFVRNYRHTPMATGERTPMETVLGYRPRGVLDLLNPRAKVVKFSKPLVEEIDKKFVKSYRRYTQFVKNDKAYYYSHYKNTANWLP